MTCSQCRHEFCWICMKNWRGHKACNTFGGLKDQPGDAGATDARAELAKFVHFSDRYENNRRAVKFAETTLETTRQKSSKLHAMRNKTVLGADFLLEAVATVIDCRRVIAWTYVYGFYLDVASDSSQQQFFNMQQQQLEEFTDKLHELAEEKEIEKLMSLEMEKEVKTLTAVIKKYRANIVDTLENSNLPTTLDIEMGQRSAKKNKSTGIMQKVKETKIFKKRRW